VNSIGAKCLRLYEAKLIHQFNHRWATYAPERDDGEISGDARDLSVAALQDPSTLVMPRHWVPASDVASRWPEHQPKGWLLGYRDIVRSTDERSAIFTIIPRSAAALPIRLVHCGRDLLKMTPCILSNSCSFAFDFCARQKIGGAHLTFSILKQLPVIPPSRYEEEFCGERLADVIAGRVLELVYTAWDIRAFALDLGDEERRAQWGKCALGAA
jgi:hypothetical protein